MSNAPKPYPWSSVTGGDFGKAIRQGIGVDSILWSAFDHIYIAAHTQNQLDVFVSNYHMPRSKVHRVSSGEDITGLIPNSRTLFFLLPAWSLGLRGNPIDFINIVKSLGFNPTHITEEQILRKTL
jgi:hypothetical protein